MSRDYKKETEKRKEKTKRFVADIDKDLSEKFIKKLDKPYTVWLKEQIESFLKK